MMLMRLSHYKNARPHVPCRRCKGEGFFFQSNRRRPGAEARISINCSACDGSGWEPLSDAEILQLEIEMAIKKTDSRVAKACLRLYARIAEWAWPTQRR